MHADDLLLANVETEVLPGQGPDCILKVLGAGAEEADGTEERHVAGLVERGRVRGERGPQEVLVDKGRNAREQEGPGGSGPALRREDGREDGRRHGCGLDAGGIYVGLD